LSDADLCRLEDAACPGAGACGGQFTANTMAIALEFLGIAALGSGSVPANDPKKKAVARAAGERVMDLLRRNLRPRDIITRSALENAIASVATTGGSTNAVLHLVAIAHEAGIELSLSDFDRISARTPLLADLKPSGRFVATDLHAAGGSPLVAKRLVEAGAINGKSPTVTGRSLTEEAAAAVETPGQEVVRPVARPLKPTGGLVILRGSLAPEGAVMKISGADRLQQRGPARVFDSEEAAFDAVQHQQIKAGDIIVIRYEGPSGGPGMREMLAVTGAIVGAGLVILRGSLAPEGAVMKISGADRLQQRGPARVFDSEEAAFDAVQHQQIKAGDIIVIRYEGPSGGPGMREMLAVTGAIVGAGLG